MVEKLSQKEYGKKIGVTQAAISYRLSNGIALPGVLRIERMSRFYILHFDSDTDLQAAKNIFKKTY